MVICEMDDRPKRLSVIKVILDLGVSRQTGDSPLNPRITADPLRLWQDEVLHDAKAFRIRPELGMPKTRAGIFISVRKRQFVPNGVFLQKAESVADTDIVIGLGRKSRPVKIRPKHDEQVCTGPRFLFVAGRRILRLVLRRPRGGQRKGKTDGREGACAEIR